MSESRITALPADRGCVATEQRHALSGDLDAMSILECAELMASDQLVAVEAVRAAAPAIARFIEALTPRVEAGGRLMYLGAGTSGRLGVLDASECPPTFAADPEQIVGIIAGGDAAMRRSSEGKEDDPRGAAEEFDRLLLGEGDTVLGIAAGGTTPYVLGGVGIAMQRGAMTGLLTCASIASPLACDHLIELTTGAELLTGSTRLKAGTATKIALNIITTTLFVQLGKTCGNLMVDLRASNDKLADRAIRILIELFPELTRDAAATLLDSAGGALKRAIVMHARSVPPREADTFIEANGGRLRTIVGRT